MPDQQASTTAVQNDRKKPYPTQDHRIKLFQELNIAPLQKLMSKYL